MPLEPQGAALDVDGVGRLAEHGPQLELMLVGEQRPQLDETGEEVGFGAAAHVVTLAAHPALQRG
ncbi:hypothetical protein GCM10025874_23220 [Arenivirga flava]|uniref:Uncharacterized protein n=1 Tax=Arenivirga flava TaxID=1930060 RepID=A0AA37X9W7_9MICO|nr:hypothetical protein [Arenivirga flava]GMA29069.1 hypothetical protein GCM10025874_23220 [Arenivirga flava]